MKRFTRYNTGARHLLGTALGAGALLAAAVISAPSAGASTTPACLWQPLYLLNGWQSDSAAYGTADPVYCVDGGFVYLAGSLRQPASGSQEFAQLPPQALPASVSYIGTYTFSGTAGFLVIDPDGSLYAEGGNATSFTSLDGISFPLASTPTLAIPLTNGWQSAHALYGTGDPSYAKSGSIVHLAGSLTNSVANPDSTFTPAAWGFDADGCITTPVYTFGGSVGDLYMNDLADYNGYADYAYGAVLDEKPSGDYGRFTSLAGVAYPAAGTAWQPISLSANWTVKNNGCPYLDPNTNTWRNSYTPAYYVSGGIVYLRGLIQQLSLGCTLAVLPPAARPQTTEWFSLSGYGNSSADLSIKPDGTMCAWSNGQTPGHALASLSGISYQLSS